MGDRPERDEALAAAALLAEPVRRALYEYVAAAPAEVGRDEAADAVGASRSLTAFHLDKLVDAGLLTATYRRLSGRSGPGAGRPAKLYRRAEGERAVSLPPRDYPSAARLLAGVVEDAGLDRELQAAARSAGAASAEPLGVEDILVRRGYEPFHDGATVRLRNCPFHRLAQEFPPLVCGMNLALIEGLLSTATDGAQWSARMDPRPDTCCVALRRRTLGPSKTKDD
jgi:predicted ArsR family transcriptional regulator